MENNSRLRMGNTCVFQLGCLVFFACGTLAIPADLSSTIDGQDFPRVTLFVFGDSLYDAGNNNYINTTLFKANFLPYGETYFEFATGRFNDGRVIPDFIAKFAKLPLIPPYFMSGYRQFAYGVNFASGGSGALDETNQGQQVIGLNKQLIYFKDVIRQLRKRTLGVKKTKELLRNAVYMFSVGYNDLLSPSPIFSSLSSKEYVQIVTGNFSAVVKEVYKAGGRKFGFINLFKLGCTPYNRVQILGRNDGDVCAKGNVTSLGKQYNAALSKEIERLQKQRKGFMYSKFDIYTAGLQRIRNPSQYGFSEVRSACCGSGVDRSRFSCGGKRGEPDYELCKNPDEFLFFDAFHPTEKADQQFAELMWDGPPTLTAPYTLKSLFELYP